MFVVLETGIFRNFWKIRNLTASVAQITAVNLQPELTSQMLLHRRSATGLVGS